MLSVFPIHFLSLLAYFILRVAVGLTLLYLAWLHLRYKDELKNVLLLNWWPYGTFSTWLLAIGELLLAGFIIIGAYTQVATLITALMCLKLILLRHWFDHPTIPSRLFYFLLLAACLSLTITGAGAFAVDLPL